MENEREEDGKSLEASLSLVNECVHAFEFDQFSLSSRG